MKKFTECTRFLENSSFSECVDKVKFTNTLSELLLYISSAPSELAILYYSTISSLSVLIKNYIRNRK